jgi:two-component system, sensor histidine kinase and response regulator
LTDIPVLVVDDNATNRHILDDMLARWRMKPALAEGGERALELMRQARDAGEAFPLLLTDAHMPGMDGFALVERIRQDPTLAGATIMMLTSGGQRGDAARCRQLGVAAYLTKPIRQSELRDAILTVLGAKTAAEGRPRLVTRHTLREGRRGLRILLAEDNVVNQRLAVRLLEKRGHHVTVATNGREVLTTLENAVSTGFDLILMDVQMPEMSGFEATGFIREKEKVTGKRLPIIAMTASALKGDRERCLAAGMDDYIAKPVQSEDLFAAIERLVEAPGAAPPDSAPVASAVLRKEAILDRAGGDLNLLRQIIEIFAVDCPRMMANLRKAAEAKNPKALQDAAHALKGAISNFSTVGAFESALRLEVTGHNGDLTGVEDILATLEQDVATLNAALEEKRTERVSPMRS